VLWLTQSLGQKFRIKEILTLKNTSSDSNVEFISSSSTGTTAHCVLWPVEQDPSIFSYLLPTLSIIVKSIQLFRLFDFHNNKFFYCVGLLAPRQTTNLEDQGIPFCLGHHP
jgi:catabolite regulation protein CreA